MNIVRLAYVEKILQIFSTETFVTAMRTIILVIGISKIQETKCL